MKKMFILLILSLFTILMLSSCRPLDDSSLDNSSSSNPSSNNSFLGNSSSETSFLENSSKDTSTVKSYDELLEELKKSEKDIHYTYKDIDGNGTDELLIHENTALTVYTLENGVKMVGQYDFVTGTLRLLYSDDPNFPGIFYFTVGGGKDHYGYLTIKDDSLNFEKLWEYEYSADPVKIYEISPNKELIEQSKAAYDNNRDIVFTPIK